MLTIHLPLCALKQISYNKSAKGVGGCLLGVCRSSVGGRWQLRPEAMGLTLSVVPPVFADNARFRQTLLADRKDYKMESALNTYNPNPDLNPFTLTLP